MFNVKLYQFAKRNDSTKEPIASTGVEYQCALKDNTGVLSPVFRFRYSAIEQIYLNNYMSISAFNRLYFINDWQFVSGEWIAYCNIDVLATYKQDISLLTATIERCSNQYFQNKSIPDPLSIVGPRVLLSNSDIIAQIGDFANDPSDGGFFIVGINNGEAITGAVAYYALTFKAFYQTVNFLMKQNPFNWETSLNNKVNPLQYINSVYWCPLLANQFSDYTPINSIILFQNSIGNGNVSIQLDSSWGQCYSIFRENDEQKGLIKYLQYNIVIPAISESEALEWLTTTSYRYLITAPYTGTFEIPAEFAGNMPHVAKVYYLKYKIQLDTGDAVVAVSTSSDTSYNSFYKNNILTFNTRVGSNVLYGDRQSNIGDVLFKSMASIGSAFSSGSLTPTVGSHVTAKYDLWGDLIETETKEIEGRPSFNAIQTAGSTIGSTNGLLSAIGSFSSNTIVRGSSPTYLDAIDFIHLSVFKKTIANTFDTDDVGFVVEKELQISDVVENRTETFIKCRTAHVDFNCTATERSMIESYLLNGFHFE